MGKSTKFTLFNALTGRGLHDQACSYRVFVNIKTTANRVQYLHYFGIFLSSHGNLLFIGFCLFLRMPWFSSKGYFHVPL